VVKRDGRVIAAAQCGIVKPPIMRSGIAHVRWGPLWRMKNGAGDPEDFRQAIRALRNEYAFKRGLLLRIYPNLLEDEAGACAGILQEEGYTPWRIGKRDRTLVIDLEKSIPELRSGLGNRWRRHLKRAEKSSLDLVEGWEDDLFAEFMPVYREMLDIKGIDESTDITRFRRAQKRLLQQYKMRIFLCRKEGKACAGIIASAIGKIGITLFRATNGAGRKCEAAYLVHWRALEWLKEQGCKGYDLDGINPVTNPGTYQYKSGLCGRNGRDVQFLGQFENCESEFTGAFVRTGEKFLRSYRSARQGNVMKRVRASFAGVRGRL
jgi:lipid II:glycine glycyltransferase (peptidoglycan interpeptide bridge formation enzyme)